VNVNGANWSPSLAVAVLCCLVLPMNESGSVQLNLFLLFPLVARLAGCTPYIRLDRWFSNHEDDIILWD